jgi:hypothetical protein
MEFYKTTILPTDDSSLALRIFNELIFEEPLVLFVVLGKGSNAETLVRRAAKFAGAKEEPRWIVWARNPDDIQKAIEKLNGEQSLVGAIGSARAFSLSLSDTVKDVIRGDEPEPDFVRIFKAFAKAEEG